MDRKEIGIPNVNRVMVRLVGDEDAGGEVEAKWDEERRHPRTGRPVLRMVE